MRFFLLYNLSCLYFVLISQFFLLVQVFNLYLKFFLQLFVWQWKLLDVFFIFVNFLQSWFLYNGNETLLLIVNDEGEILPISDLICRSQRGPETWPGRDCSSDWPGSGCPAWGIRIIVKSRSYTGVIPSVVDEVLQHLVFGLQLADISVQHVEPLPGDPERRDGEDEGEEQDGEPGTVEPGAARAPLLRALLGVLRVCGGFDHRLLLVHCRPVSRDAAVREGKRKIRFDCADLVSVREKLTSFDRVQTSHSVYTTGLARALSDWEIHSVPVCCL